MKLKVNYSEMSFGSILIYVALVILFVLGIDWLLWKLYQIIDDILLKYQITDLPDFGFWEFFFLLIGVGIIINILSRIFKK